MEFNFESFRVFKTVLLLMDRYGIKTEQEALMIAPCVLWLVDFKGYSEEYAIEQILK